MQWKVQTKPGIANYSNTKFVIIGRSLRSMKEFPKKNVFTWKTLNWYQSYGQTTVEFEQQVIASYSLGKALLFLTVTNNRAIDGVNSMAVLTYTILTSQ